VLESRTNGTGVMPDATTSQGSTERRGLATGDRSGGGRAEARATASARSASLGLLSTVLHKVGDATSRAGVAAGVAIAVTIFLLVLARVGFPESWQIEFATVAAAVTLVMVFVIQHTQNRQQLATQLKLDELIRASSRADDRLVHIESAGDSELVSLERDQIDHHTSVRDRSCGSTPSP
jgi:low affinity Fe/Cu permease